MITHASFSEQGKRRHNEDAIKISLHNQTECFVLCDGLGGEGNGHIASRIAVNEITHLFANTLFSEHIEERILEAIESAEKGIAAHIEADPTTQGMSTTLVILVIHQDCAYIAHIGDSRLYLIRDGNILLETQDHTVQQDGAYVLSKSVNGQFNPLKPTMQPPIKLQANDVYFLCTDGVLEAVTHTFLIDCFLKYPIDKAMQRIIKQCRLYAKDNFSAIAVKVN